MKHSDALTDQQKADCLLTVGDWDAHCANVLANIQAEAAKTRLNAAVAKLKGLSTTEQQAAIDAVVATIPAATVDAAVDSAKPVQVKP